jgi:hypothetical protein
MKKLITIIMILLILPFTASAQNTPCSGKKGGVSHCDGSKFVCNDGSYSKSKSTCSRHETNDNAINKTPDILDTNTSPNSENIKKKQK